MTYFSVFIQFLLSEIVPLTPPALQGLFNLCRTISAQHSRQYVDSTSLGNR